MRGHPPIFAHSVDPMDAEDWLRTVEHEMHTAHEAPQSSGTQM
jgi:hypothetical protein